MKPINKNAKRPVLRGRASRRQKFFAHLVLPNSITFSPTAAVRRALHAAGGSSSDLINAAIIFTLAKP